MSKWKCDECGYEFDEPYIYREEDVGFEGWWCPSCHSDAITEVKECANCGEVTPVYDLTADGYCDNCVEATRKKFNLFLKSKFEREELEILKDQWMIDEL